MNKLSCIALLLLLILSACTDYEGVLNDNYESWKEEQAEKGLSLTSLSSSSITMLSSSQGIMSNNESYSSETYSSSMNLSSSAISNFSQNNQSSSSEKCSGCGTSSSSLKNSSSSEYLSSSFNFQSSSSLIDESVYNSELNTLTDLRDNHVYETVTIGTQIWMAENLNYNYNSGSAKSFCYNNEEYNCDVYGRLYTWAAAMDSSAVFSMDGKGCGYYGVDCSDNEKIRGVCPEGWHLPSNGEWITLFFFVGDMGTAGGALKSTNGWNSNGNGRDTYNFSVLPGGLKNYSTTFSYVEDKAYFWNSTEENSSNANGWSFYYEKESIIQVGYDKGYAFSVRCIKNSGDDEIFSIESSSSSITDSSVYDAATNTLTDLRDNQTYKTTTIGSQIWMAENLNYAYNEPTSTLDSSSFCYNNSVDSCSKYGHLYLLSAAVDSLGFFSTAGKNCGYGKNCNLNIPIRGSCPQGWHLPSENEWDSLFIMVGKKETAGAKLKSLSGWFNNANGINSFDFSAMPGGFRLDDGEFSNGGSLAYFWGVGSGNVYRVGMYYEYDQATLDISYDDWAYSIRCLKD